MSTTQADRPPRNTRSNGRPRSRVGRWIYLLRPLQMLVMALYFRSTVRGRQHVPRTGPLILCPTHRTRWDTIVLYSAVYGRRLRWLTSHNEVTGKQGWIVRRLGAFPINTARPTPGALKHCGEILLAGEALVIFPEGDIFRLPPGWVHTLKPGTAWLALQVQKELGNTPLTIVPVRLNFGRRFVRFRCPVEVDVRPPLYASNYLDLPRDDAIARLTADLQTALGDHVDSRSKAEIDAASRAEEGLPPEPPPVASHPSPG